MSCNKLNQRSPGFEKLESRWLLAADSVCQVAVEPQVPTDNAERVAELLDPVEANVDGPCDENHTMPNRNASESRSAETPDIGGEGEFVPNADEGERLSDVRAAEVLGQMLVFVNDRQEFGSSEPATERRLFETTTPTVLPPDFQRANTSIASPTDDPAPQVREERHPSVVEPSQPAATVASELANAAHDTTSSLSREVSPGEIELPVDGEDNSDRQSAMQQAAIPVEPHRTSDSIESSLRMLRADLDSNWLGRETIPGIESDAVRDESDVDQALMAYLQTIQWPLVPLVAGLAYAVTRSLDRQAESDEPNTLLLGKRRLRTGPVRNG